jgi:hypothetical protein
MRVWISSLLGLIILVLPTVLEADDVARPPQPPRSAAWHVTGALDFPEGGAGGGAGVFGDHALQWREVDVEARLSTSDPRLSGALHLTWNCDVFRPDWVHETSGAVVTGAVILRNGGGSWEGVWRGLTYPGRAGYDHHILLSGVGRYGDLSALLYVTDAKGDHDLVVEGLAFPGEMPPRPELPGAS